MEKVSAFVTDIVCMDIGEACGGGINVYKFDFKGELYR